VEVIPGKGIVRLLPDEPLAPPAGPFGWPATQHVLVVRHEPERAAVVIAQLCARVQRQPPLALHGKHVRDLPAAPCPLDVPGVLRNERAHGPHVLSRKLGPDVVEVEVGVHRDPLAVLVRPALARGVRLPVVHADVDVSAGNAQRPERLQQHVREVDAEVPPQPAAHVLQHLQRIHMLHRRVPGVIPLPLHMPDHLHDQVELSRCLFGKPVEALLLPQDPERGEVGVYVVEREAAAVGPPVVKTNDPSGALRGPRHLAPSAQGTLGKRRHDIADRPRWQGGAARRRLSPAPRPR